MSSSAHLNTKLRSVFNQQSASGKPVLAQPTQAATPQVPPIATTETTAGKLAILNQVLSDIEAQSDSSPDSLNPVQPTASMKEVESQITPDIGPIEAGAGLSQVEYEPSPELPVEVESFLEKVEEQPDPSLAEVIVADGSTGTSAATAPVKKPVIILPITPEVEKEGKKKPLHWSIRWLVEWSHKIMKMFVGEVVYRQEET